MSKGLEALKRVKRFSVLLDSEKDIVKDLVEIIPNTLKTIEKELKALEIIKPLVDLTKEQKHCWLWLGLNGRQITQEQYDLLKDILL